MKLIILASSLFIFLVFYGIVVKRADGTHSGKRCSLKPEFLRVTSSLLLLSPFLIRARGSSVTNNQILTRWKTRKKLLALVFFLSQQLGLGDLLVPRLDFPTITNDCKLLSEILRLKCRKTLIQSVQDQLVRVIFHLTSTLVFSKTSIIYLFILTILTGNQHV